MNTKRFAARARRNWLDIKAFVRSIHKFLLQICSLIIPFVLFIAVSITIYEFGFRPFWSDHQTINLWINILLDSLIVVMGVRLLLDFFQPRKKSKRIINMLGYAFVLFLSFFILPAKASAGSETNLFLLWKIVLYGGILFTFIVEVSYMLRTLYKGKVSAALLFVLSFAFLILIGTLLLKLPTATSRHISVLDALFTSASAVCVTGLIVVDTATQFTTFGKLIILGLIQIGALGIMTFAGLFAYAVAGGTSIKTQLAFRDVMSGREIGNILRFTFNVVVVTLLFELVGAILIYINIPSTMFPRRLDKIFFSIFHSVSAFCNAGFSTLTNGLYEPVIRYNYGLQFFVAVLIILGGMGFPIVFNIYKFLKVKISNLLLILQGNPRRHHFPNLLSLNSRLALTVSGILLLIGFVSYLLFEQYNSLLDHPTLEGKLITSFFGSVTPRTAGFNTVNMSALSLPMIMIYLLMMWIGASPGSTGGGIKTTTAGVALLNIASVLKGKDRTEFYMSEVSMNSIRRAFAVISLSLLFIGFSVFLVSINDSNKGLIKIAFEVFSAFSTVGLTLGITPDLSTFSKAVIIVTMFVGRIGTVTLMVAFIRQTKTLYYRYPKEDITF